MKFDVAIPCFFGSENFYQAIKTVKSLGFNAVEGYNWKNLDTQKIKQVCKKTGVSIVSLCTSSFNLTDERYRQEWLDGLKESCEFAADIGVNRLITQSGPDTGEKREKQHANIVETLKAAVPILEQYGVTVMLEPLNVLVDHKDTYLYSSAEAFEIVREVNSGFVKVIYDIYHQQVTEGNIIANLTANIDLVAHIHAAGTPGRHELQSGECDYINIFKAVDSVGYSGYCGLEYNPLLPSEESLKEFTRAYKEIITA